MRFAGLSLFCLTFIGTPAFAHHEIVVATSMMPLALMASTFGLSVIAAILSYVRKNKNRRASIRSGMDQD